MDPELIAELRDFMKHRHFGKHRGKVVSNSDPTKRGRLKVTVESVLGSLEVWAMPCVPYAGPGVGLCSLPPEKAGVWIEFERGDPSFPIWTGCFWADDELPLGGTAAKKIWKTDSITMVLDDENDQVTVENQAKSNLTLAQTISSTASKAKHEVGAQGVTSELGSGKVEVTAAAVILNSKFQVS